MRVSLWVALAALTFGGQAQAGQSGHSTDTPLSNVKPFRELQNFGTCFARTHRRGALTLIATPPGSPEEEKAFNRMVFGDDAPCLAGGTRMSMPIIFARGAIAEGLLRSEGVPDTHRLASLSPGEAKDLHGVARCYTSKHRTNVEKLLQTPPGTREEVTAVAGLWPDFKTCMPGFNVRLNAPWIRFLLAEALLRLEPDVVTSGS